MKKYIAKIISITLTLTMLFSSLPTEVIARELNSIETPSESFTDGLNERHEPSVVAEITDRRSESCKEFIMDNGVRMAVVYPMAVHYQENGEWQEIDNTLTLSREDGTYHNTAGKWDVALPASLDSKSAVTVTRGEHELSFRFDGALSGKGKTAPEKTAASVDKRTEKAIDASREVLEKSSSSVTYEKLFSDTDIRYELVSNRLKESIIINSSEAVPSGYQYILETDLTLELREDGEILALAAGEEEPVFYLPAPYLYDSADAFCGEIEINLEKTSSGYLLFYLLPQAWMSDESREYPIALDPVVQADSSALTIEDQTVSEYQTLDYRWGKLQVGYLPTSNNGLGKERAFIKFNNIPSLTSADVIVSARLSLEKSDSTLTGIMEAHQVTGGTWSSQTITWSNMPTVKDEVEDYLSVSSAGFYYWDVTCSAQFWYSSGMNTGVMFRMPDDVENGNTQKYLQFYSSDFGPWDLPVLQLFYINNCGLEDTWDYLSQSAGRAGTGYVNSYTGNLVWVHQGLGFAGNRMPVSINAIYNANDKSNNSFGLGYGWRTNYNQLVYQWSVNSNYYVWEDADGTRHYFLYDSSAGKYVDELNSKRTLTTSGSGTTKYHLADEDNFTDSYFDTYGRLTKISNRQATVSNVTVTYISGTGSKLISRITDGAGRKYDFVYSGSALSRINFLGTGTTTISYLTYGQTSSQLTSVGYPDGKTVYFTYGSNHLLLSAKDVDGYKVAYTYNIYTTSEPNRVNNIKEYSGTTLGGELEISYAHNQTILTDAVRGNKEILQFNNWGSTLSVQNDLGQATFSRYVNQNSGAENNGKTGSQLALSSKLQSTVVNLAANGNMELSLYWKAYSGNPSTGSWSYSTAEKYSGNRSLVITNTAAAAYRVQGNSAVNPSSSKTYTLSAYIKTGTLTGGTGAKLAIANGNTGALLAVSEAVPSGTDWTRVEVSCSAGVPIVPCFINDASGSAYFDCVQFERSTSASRYNLVENGDLRYTSFWQAGTSTVSGEGRVDGGGAPAEHMNKYVICQKGSATAQKYYYQNLSVPGSAGDVFTLAGWGKGAAVSRETDSSRRFGLMLRFNYTNGTTGEFYVDFNPDLDADVWQYAAGRAVAERAYSSVQVRLVYYRDCNTAYFDGIQLYKEEFGQTYTYDSDGNIVSTVDLQKQQTNYTYSNNNLVRIAIGSGTNAPAYTYTYDSYHNVVSATTPEGVSAALTYDTYGNNTKVTLGSNPKIEVSAAYTSSGNILSTVTSASGKVTTYGYDTQTGVLNWVEGPYQGTTQRTNYTHDNLYRTTGVSQGSGSATYTYNGSDLLSVLTNGSGTEYSFLYDIWSHAASVSAGDYTLLSNTYVSDRDHRISAVTYGNGDSVTPEYDDYGRVVKRTWDDNSTEKYTYDSNGNLGRVTDGALDRTTKNYYDFLDRLARCDETGTGYSNSVRWVYDVKNRLTSQTQTLNGTTYTTGYTYDDDNRTTGMSQGSVSAEYTYDSLGRITGINDKNGSSTVVNTSISYRTFGGNKTNTQVATFSSTAGGNTTTYTYEYQPRDQVYRVNDGTNTVSYTYTVKDVLTRENNQAAGKTWIYTYDDSGNILTKSEYVYTAGVGQPASTPITSTYTYGDSTWGDLLTAYNGQPLTYDGIGNLTGDGTWSYTWKHGRELSSMTDGTNTISYLYNYEGRRAGKTVNGVEYSYTYAGSTLTDVTWGTNSMHFVYDVMGAAAVIYNGTTYYYLRNAMGDITGIVDSTGAQVVSYTYDAWGKLLGTAGTMAATLGQDNPLRYRGYVYDGETGLYYLTSRYYNPEWCRFINADDVSYLGADGSVVSGNLFAYCGNNPVRLSDETGTWPNWATKLAIGIGAIVIGAAIVAATAATGGAAAAFVGAAVAGLKAAAVSGAIGAAVGAGTSVVSQRISTGSWSGAGKAAIEGAIDGFASGFMTGGIMAGVSMTYGAVTQYANGIKIGSTAKPQYGKVNIGYGNPSNCGNTIISIQNDAGKSIFRLETDVKHLLHMHYGATKAAMKIHRTGIIRFITGVIAGFEKE